MLNCANSQDRDVFKRRILSIIIISFVISAFIIRLYILIINGAFESNQLYWSIKNYMGGISKYYIDMSLYLYGELDETRIPSYPPGYPILINIMRFIFQGELYLLYLRIFQILIDSFSIILLFYALKKISRSGIFASAGCGIYVVSAWYANGASYLLAESLLPAMFITLIASMVAIRDRPGKLRHWMLLGLFAAIMPLFRSDMILMFIPLMVWAFLVAPQHQRLLAAASVLLAFAAPLFLWMLRNYIVHDALMLTPPVRWYAAWAGLGQIPNSFGYFVSDQRAYQLLASKGLVWHSLQAENFWRKEYIDAWIHHPHHVFETIMFRIKSILFTYDDEKILNYKYKSLIDSIFYVQLFSFPASFIYLIYKNRLLDLFLILIPAGYAVCSLGILYFEPRYVRYSALSYILAFPIFLVAFAELPSLFLGRWGAGQARVVRVVVATLAIGAAIVCYSILAPSLRAMAIEAAYSNMKEPRSMEALPWSGNLDDFSIHKSIPDVEASKLSDGVRFSFEAQSGRYLLEAPLRAEPGSSVFVKYKVRLEEGSLGIGILSDDKTKWLSFRPLSRAEGGVLEGGFLHKVEAGSSLIITSEESDGRYSVVFEDLRWRFSCPQNGAPEPILLLFSKDFASMGPCPSNKKIE